VTAVYGVSEELRPIPDTNGLLCKNTIKITPTVSNFGTEDQVFPGQTNQPL
jgi:hypothetical protein